VTDGREGRLAAECALGRHTRARIAKGRPKRFARGEIDTTEFEEWLRQLPGTE